MQTIQFDIDDNHVDTFLRLTELLEDGMIKNLKIVNHDSMNDELHHYTKTTQFQKDKEMLQQRFADIESGKTICIPWSDGLSDLDTFIDNIS